MLYTIRFFDSQRSLASMFNMISKDDTSAIAIFESIKREYAMELRQGERVIAQAEPDRVVPPIAGNLAAS